jgi:hypothetical protein
MAEAKHLRTVDRPIAYGHWIAGRDVASAATFSSYNPTTGAVWGTFALGSRDEVGAAVAAAKSRLREPGVAFLVAHPSGSTDDAVG